MIGWDHMNLSDVSEVSEANIASTSWHQARVAKGNPDVDRESQLHLGSAEENAFAPGEWRPAVVKCSCTE
jgi:hypothetical protein